MVSFRTYLHCLVQRIHTFYKRSLQLALGNRKGGSIFPDTWLSLTGTVAQFGPDYPITEAKYSKKPPLYKMVAFSAP